MDRFAYQRTTTDCARCSIATLLDIPYRSVPDFYTRYRKQKTQFKAIEAWLSKRGLTLVKIPANMEPDCLYLAAGLSRRGFWHMVVMWKGEMVHDPYGDGLGLRRVRKAWVVVPQDVGAP